ncbi:MAG: ROK family protein [Elusimicrobia bacterium]|nr:ROK family protein [Elusimicrobiota bacterium]
MKLGIDLGGTKIEGVVLDDRGRVRWRRRIPTRRELGYDGILGRIALLHQRMLRAAGPGPHTLGIGTPGGISPRTGLLRNSNTLCLNGRPLARDLERKLERPLAVHNDANCFALAEAARGAGRGHRVVFGVILGTGCGGGIVFDGKIWEGRQGIAGEWGHHSIDPAGPACYCGQRGCVEALISGGGLERAWRERYGSPKRLPEIVRAARRGDRRAAAFLGEFLSRFGRALANVIDVLDPDVIVLGGGVSNLRELYTRGKSEVRARVFNDRLETPIVRHELGDSAGVIGAALLGITRRS